MGTTPPRPKPTHGNRRGPALLLAVVIGVSVLVSTGSPGSAASPAPWDKDPTKAEGVVTWSAAEDGATTPTGGGRSGVGRAVPSTTNLEFVALSTGCRVLDTRIAGGAFAANQFRDLSVRDAGLPAGLGPCGIPNRAKAIDLSLSTLAGSPTGAGYVRVGPGGAEPTATVLQFLTGQGTSVTTSTGLNGSGQMRVKSYGAGTGLVADVLGYWQQPIQGRVNGDGTLTSGSGVVSILKSSSFLGDYTITFDRPVNGCAAVTDPDFWPARIFGYPGAANQWFFDAREYNSLTDIDSGFTFAIQC